MADEPVKYRGSDGREHDIALMPFPYLSSALAKLIRQQPDRRVEIDAMTAEVAKRNDEYAKTIGDDEALNQP